MWFSVAQCVPVWCRREVVPSRERYFSAQEPSVSNKEPYISDGYSVVQSGAVYCESEVLPSKQRFISAKGPYVSDKVIYISDVLQCGAVWCSVLQYGANA